MKLDRPELVLETKVTRKTGWLYYLNKHGDICRGKMGALISVNPARYAKPELVESTKIKRKKGYLYRINDGGDIIRQLIL